MRFRMPTSVRKSEIEKENPMASNVCPSRRSLVKGAGVATLAAAALGAASASADEAVASGAKYDVDILVVGAGLAGLSAAIRVIEAGADPERVLVIDKMSGEGADYGGSSLVMSGNYLLATDTSDEGKQAFIDAMYEVTGKTQDYEMLTLLGQRGNDVMDWLVGLGCGYSDPAETSTSPAASTRTMTAEARAIPVLVEVLADKGSRIAYGTKAWQLNRDASGVCGVLASDADGYFDIAAKKTILATGGFLSNPGMLEEYLGDNAGLIVSRAPWSITGDGITMVKEVGGTMAGRSRGMKACYLSCTSADNPTSAHATRAMGYSIAINANGERYADEAMASVTQDHHRALVNQPGCTMGMLSDSKQAENLQAAFDSYEGMGVPVYTCETLEEVAELFGCPIEALQSTVDEFNAHVVDDHTEGLAINKTSKAATIDTPPYYAFYPFILTSSFLGAGIKVDTQARVVGGDKQPIANLYAAGELTGSTAYDEYFHGANSLKAAVLGYIAGEEAVTTLA